MPPTGGVMSSIGPGKFLARRSADIQSDASQKRQFLLFHRAGIPARQRTGRAPADKPGGQRHDAGPGPQSDRSRGGQSGQDQASGNAKQAVNAAGIEFPGGLS